MKQYLFSVYDVKADVFNAPIALLSKAAAIRSFTDALAEGKSEFAKHPEDFSLWLIASWNPASGELIPAKAPERVITALECMPDTVTPALHAVN